MNIAGTTKDFLLFSFEYVESDSFYRSEESISFNALIGLLESILIQFESAKNNKEDLFFLLSDKGIREAVNQKIKENTEKGAHLLQDITSENQIDDLFGFISDYSKFKGNETVRSILSHFLREIYEILSEYETISINVFNRVETEYTNRNELSIKKVYEGYIQTKDELDSLTKENKVQRQELRTEVNNLKNTANGIRTAIKNSEKQVTEKSITILGIFASIVLVFNASVSFYAETIKAFSDADPYKIIFFFSLIGLIVLAAIMGLVCYLDSVRNGKVWTVAVPFCIVEVLLIVCMGLIWCSGRLEENSASQHTSFVEAESQIQEFGEP